MLHMVETGRHQINRTEKIKEKENQNKTKQNKEYMTKKQQKSWPRMWCRAMYDNTIKSRHYVYSSRMHVPNGRIAYGSLIFPKNRTGRPSLTYYALVGALRYVRGETRAKKAYEKDCLAATANKQATLASLSSDRYNK